MILGIQCSWVHWLGNRHGTTEIVLRWYDACRWQARRSVDQWGWSSLVIERRSVQTICSCAW